MARINPNFDKLKAGYLFPEIAARTKAFIAEFTEKNGEDPGICHNSL